MPSAPSRPTLTTSGRTSSGSCCPHLRHTTRLLHLPPGPCRSSQPCRRPLATTCRDSPGVGTLPCSKRSTPPSLSRPRAARGLNPFRLEIDARASGSWRLSTFFSDLSCGDWWHDRRLWLVEWRVSIDPSSCSRDLLAIPRLFALQTYVINSLLSSMIHDVIQLYDALQLEALPARLYDFPHLETVLLIRPATSRVWDHSSCLRSEIRDTSPPSLGSPVMF